MFSLQECGDIRNIANDWLSVDGIHPFWQCGWNGYNVFYYGWHIRDAVRISCFGRFIVGKSLGHIAVGGR